MRHVKRRGNAQRSVTPKDPFRTEHGKGYEEVIPVQPQCDAQPDGEICVQLRAGPQTSWSRTSRGQVRAADHLGQ